MFKENRQERLKLVEGPTPLQYLESLSGKLDRKIYIKRDDLTGIGGGGNKLRKLEYLIYDAMKKGADRVLTVGGVQTNHGRLTAAVCAGYGLKCTVLSVGEYPGELSANMLLTRMMGADIVIGEPDGRSSAAQYADLIERLTLEYEKAGEKIYFIPLGGSNTIGMKGYHDCGLEIIGQIKEQGIGRPHVISTLGSGGTYLGLLQGLITAGIPLTGIAIMDYTEDMKENLLRIYNESSRERNLPTIDSTKMDIRYGFVRGGYNVENGEVRAAVRLMAETEGILLDPCYTGKTFAALLDLIKEGEFKEESIVFLHTGGFPGLYTPHHRRELEKDLISGVRIISNK